MFRRAIPVLAAILIGLALASPTLAQSMTVATFLQTAEPIPRNPTSLARADTRRLIREVTRSVERLKADQAEAQRIGARPAHCIPASGTGIKPETLLARFEAIPAGRRHITVLQALRDGRASPLPAGAPRLNGLGFSAPSTATHRTIPVHLRQRRESDRFWRGPTLCVSTS
ncbi:hypothetical protein [Brevundimonas sp.]|uniref:hypothetical protein n=1 Tax=Brevundimonas sp. TaxID=1871086 RepID=UPI0035AF8F54